MRAVALLLLLSLPAEAGTDRVVLLACRGPQKPVLGEVREYVVGIRNVTDRIVVVRGIVPLTNEAEEEVSLRSTVYGRFSRDSEDWILGREQRRSRLAVDAGLLLPGEEILLRIRYRPLAPVEELRVEGVFLPTTEGVFLAAEPRPLKLRFVPFPEGGRPPRGKEGPPILTPPGPDVPPGAVLIPEEKGAEPFARTVELRFATPEPAFPLGKARAVATRIAEGPVRLTRSPLLGNGWVVLESRATWLLRSPDQEERGELFPGLPATFLKDVDRGGVSIEVSADPTAKEGERLWDLLPVRPGDGMYTRGLFVDLPAERLLEFLRETRKRGGDFVARAYFFRARHYVLVK